MFSLETQKTAAAIHIQRLRASKSSSLHRTYIPITLRQEGCAAGCFLSLSGVYCILYLPGTEEIFDLSEKEE